MTLIVEQAALLMSVQDGGRSGYLRFGMPVSGPVDWWAFSSANLLVGNDLQAACVEMGFSTTALSVETDTLIAVCGAGYRLLINDHEMPLWMAVWVKQGDRITIEKGSGGNWVYLAAAGGIQTSAWLGSRSVYPRAQLGQWIKAGDRLPLVPNRSAQRLLAGRSLPPVSRPGYQRNPVIGVIPGPHQDRFTASSRQSFWENEYMVSSHSDRMGLRLTGSALTHTTGADLVSQGLVLGQIQVPADGQPIVMMPDHPTTGGYTSIGTVAKVDLPLLAQAQPGESTIRFTPVTVTDAQNRLADAIHHLQAGAQQAEEPWQSL